jgi:periplasmic divalent cation tolerance protein
MSVWMLYVTCRDTHEAEHIASTLLDEHLIACANVLPTMQSMYHWEGEVQTSLEAVLILKTTHAQQDAVTARICSLHSYQTPCIITWETTHGNPDFMQWVTDSVAPSA